MSKPAFSPSPRPVIAVAIVVAGVLGTPRPTQSFEQAWRDPGLAPDVRAQAVVRAMTLDEKIAIVHTHVGVPSRGKPKPAEAIGSAAIWPGVPRLGIPPQQESDGSLGVGNPLRLPQLYDVTPLPSALALAATFDPDLARAAGAMIGREARAHGFGILLAGGANLIRDPRGGRSFEYASEDPLLTGRMVGATIAGVQSADVISTLKHFALNDEETGRVALSSDLRDQAARESDLLAFELALEVGKPAAVMTSYNRVDGVYTSENAALLTILKRDWRYPGFVMSDWGGTHSTREAALAGLDQQSGEEYDVASYFADPLKQAVVRDQVPQTRLDDMARRVLRSNFASGIADRPPVSGAPVDLEADAALAQKIAERSLVLLKNDHDELPLRANLGRIVVIGAHADRGVLSGGGSSQVLMPGSEPFSEEQPRHTTIGIKYFHPSPPADAIRRRAPGARVVFLDGRDLRAATEAARGADAVVVFAEQWLAESRDAADLSLPFQQDALIEAVAAANPHVVVVLETGSAVKMPWLDRVPAVVEAWYAGARGGEAIAAALFGEIDPSGRLPITFPRDEAQLPRRILPEASAATAHPGGPDVGGFDIDYDTEGADVGYKWFAAKGLKPLFPFGFGLGYARFAYSGLEVHVAGDVVTASVEVRNTGGRAGTDTPQFYVAPAGGGFMRRLAGWGRVDLAKGETRRVSVTVDPRLLASFDVGAHAWHVAGGRYILSVRPNAADVGPDATFAVGDASRAP